MHGEWLQIPTYSIFTSPSLRVLLPDTNGMNAALKILRNGGVVAHATETCYGFACDLRNPAAVAKLFAIKQRPLDQPVSALFSSVNEAKKYVQWSAEAQNLADEYLPGPLTIILPLNRGSLLSSCPLQSPSPTLGIRISSHPLSQQLIQRFGSPLSTTSANIHGYSNPYSTEDILRQFSHQEHQPDLILDSGPLPQTPPSTVIDLTQNTGDILRKGIVQVPKK